VVWSGLKVDEQVRGVRGLVRIEGRSTGEGRTRLVRVGMGTQATRHRLPLHMHATRMTPLLCRRHTLGARTRGHACR
jgi:hypothetical protein